MVPQDKKSYWVLLAVSFLFLIALMALYVDPIHAGPATSGSYCGSC